jgi:hypothetical protein
MCRHACGTDEMNCQIILQYSCGTDMRDGTSTDTISEDGGENDGGDADKGKHESKTSYQNCRTRYRNMRLFTADQKLNGNTARFTRQNPDGNRRGLECPEERDYHPYWHPTMWWDIAVLTNRVENCTMYKTESENVKGRNFCSNPMYNNQTDCETKGKATWSLSPSHNDRLRASGQPTLPEVDCLPAPWNRVNHHGTTPYNTNQEFAKNPVAPHEFNSYNWTIPATIADKCVFRLRYNISTGDYADWYINSTYNDPNSNDNTPGRSRSPIEQNPVVNIADEFNGRGLRLALNTDQFGRTFEDRSHIFGIIPSTKPGVTVWNLNVRGRRGNIAQNYPAVEYDFIPKRLLLKANTDWVHFQWTGSNNNPNNDGQGKAQTDRSNVVQYEGPNVNYPMAISKASNPALGGMFPDEATLKQFATLGSANDELLDNASPYQNFPPMTFRAGIYYYGCTRNNNFSNRSQKGVLIVT